MPVRVSSLALFFFGPSPWPACRLCRSRRSFAVELHGRTPRRLRVPGIPTSPREVDSGRFETNAFIDPRRTVDVRQVEREQDGR